MWSKDMDGSFDDLNVDLSSPLSECDDFGNDIFDTVIQESKSDDQPLNTSVVEESAVVENTTPKQKRKYTRRNTGTDDKSNKRSINSLSVEEISDIFESYSKVPTPEIIEKYNITKRGLTSLITTLEENFQMAVAHGDLTEEQFKTLLQPKLQAFEVKKVKENKITNFINTTISKIGK